MTDKSERERRLAEQLRANLRRRKAQARAVEAGEPDEISPRDSEAVPRSS